MTSAKQKRTTERTQQGVEVLHRSLERWSRYAVDVVRLASQGNLDASQWATTYAKMWRGIGDDLGDVMKLVCTERR